MSRIPAVDPATASAPVQRILDGVQRSLGAKPNLFRVAANSQAALEGLNGLIGALARGRFDARGREALALTVSEIDGCSYCLSAHSALGKGAGLTESDLEKARSGQAPDPRLAAALRLARRIVETRGHVGESAVAEARQAGLSDAELVEVVAHVALTTFTNYLNEVAATEIDFPVVSPRQATSRAA